MAQRYGQTITLSYPDKAVLHELKAKLGAPSLAAAASEAIRRTLRDENAGGIGLLAVTAAEGRRAEERMRMLEEERGAA